MDSSNGEQASSCPPRKLEVSVSSLLSEPMLDIDSATLELSLPEDAVRPIIHRVDSCHSQDWEDVEKFETFNDLDSNADSLLSNHNFPQHMDLPYLSDGHKFQDSAIDNFSSNTSNNDHLEQLVRNTESKTLFNNQELESMDFTKNIDLSKNLEDSKTSTFNFAEKDNDCASTKPVSDSCENGKLEGAVDVRESEEIAKPLQAHPEYTENFNNYKVCRVIAPGVKECLILETGEQVKCDKRQKLKDIENNLRTLKRENSTSVETTSIMTCPPPPPPPPPPPLSSSPDIVDHSAPMSTKLESNYTNGSPASVSSDKENINFEPRENYQLSENSPCHSPLHDKLAKANSCDEVAADVSGQDKLSKKVFKITKPHIEDSAVYFGNLKLGRGMNKGCPRLMFLGSCPRNKVSTGISQESKNEDKKEKRIPAAADLDLTTDEDVPAGSVQPLTLNLEDANGLSPTGYYSDPCQMKGTSWSQHLKLSPVEIGKSFDELCKGNVPQHSLAKTKEYRTISKKQDSLPNSSAIPESFTASNALNSPLAPSKSGPVPDFKSLQERQITWMLHQLEEQHLKALKKQYEQHQQNIKRIQEDMEAEILNQQASFQQKIKTSKNALIKEAFVRSNINPHISLRPNMGHPNFNSYDADIDLSDTEDSEDNLSLETMSPNEQRRFSMPPTGNHQPQASQANQKRSPVSPRRGSFSPLSDHSSLTHHMQPPLNSGLITDGRILQGGVYATPFPLSKSSLLLKSPTEISSKPESLDTDSHLPSVLGDDLKSETALLQELEQRHNQRIQQQELTSNRNFHALNDDQFTESLGLVSINDSRGNLREKHAKHLSELRLYYEKEIQELRDALSNTDSISSQSAYKKLVEENLLLTKKCQEKEEELAQQKTRDYEQQVQVYQAQLQTYAQRCTDLEKLLSDFKHQLYQETAHNHRKEARLKELESENLKQNSAIDEMIKLREEYLEDNKQKNATIQKLVTRYEKLEKEYKIIKETLTVAEERYFEANAEILYVKRENARLDFDNKRLMRENENLRQKIGSFKFFGDEETGNLNNASVNSSSSKSPRGSQRNLSSQTRQAELDLMREVGGKEMSEAFENKFTSPIMAAERELRKFRSTKKLSGKPSNSVTELDLPDGILVDLPLSMTPKTKAKTNQRQLTKDFKSKSNASTSHHTGMDPSKLSSKNKVPFHPKEVNNSNRYDIKLNDVSNSLAKDQQPIPLHQEKSNNAGSTDKSLESKLSQMCSQPQFEDLYTSLTKVQNKFESSPITVSKTQQKFQVTLDTIKKLEDRYDSLQAEKIQLEASLSRIPVSGRVDRKARQRKEDLEKKLDTIERELGSVRMSLKRFNVLKSSI